MDNTWIRVTERRNTVRGNPESRKETGVLGVDSQGCHAETTAWSRTFPRGQKEGAWRNVPSHRTTALPVCSLDWQYKSLLRI